MTAPSYTHPCLLYLYRQPDVLQLCEVFSPGPQQFLKEINAILRTPPAKSPLQIISLKHQSDLSSCHQIVRIRHQMMSCQPPRMVQQQWLSQLQAMSQIRRLTMSCQQPRKDSRMRCQQRWKLSTTKEGTVEAHFKLSSTKAGTKTESSQDAELTITKAAQAKLAP
ncbi:hypothetical protein PCANC_09904 [Puccinia coronata f. sp. avenae]|uniref:Uncharacterized protein n=1 Tax=Puccinia coronata f. sp. avenae TaxID=200324 RepID=A0A2N5UXH3_9BASI|nr:hypothetical protein PCANC_09904 [Puccinia coronata f. sp. avenae]